MKMPDIPDKIAGVPTQPIVLAIVIAVMGAIVLPFIKLDQYFPGQSKWVYGAVWFVIGAALTAFGMSGARGVWREVVLGAGISFFVAAMLQWGGWSYSK
jgi:hypothetical protein